MTPITLPELPWLRGRLPYHLSEMDRNIARDSITLAEINCARTKLLTALCVTRAMLKKWKR